MELARLKWKQLKNKMEVIKKFGGLSLDDPFYNGIQDETYWVIHFGHHSSKIKEADQWCKENCKDIFYCGMPNPFYFKFANKEDALQFKLTWG